MAEKETSASTILSDMNNREEQIIQNNLIFKGIVGSKAYGTDHEHSDTDIKGIYAQDNEDILGLGYIEQIKVTDDEVYYEIRRFLELCSTGNPNILELFNLPEDCVLYTTPTFEEVVKPNFKLFLTKQLYQSHAGFAHGQIQKAKGLNKLMNWDRDKVERKDVLDFCYVIVEKEKSIKFRQWAREYTGDSVPLHILNEDLGLAKVNNVKDLYSLYHVNGNVHGIASIDITDTVTSDGVRLSSIPKKAPHLGYFKFDKDAYSTHCKEYARYQKWVKERNPHRHRKNVEHGKDYDPKNMMHCIRIMNMCVDILTQHKIVVRRPEAEELKGMLDGHMEYEDILNMAQLSIELCHNLYEASNLPKTSDKKKVHELLVKIRDERTVGKYLNLVSEQSDSGVEKAT